MLCPVRQGQCPQPPPPAEAQPAAPSCLLSASPKLLLVVVVLCNEKPRQPYLSLEKGAGSWESLLAANSQPEETNVKELCDHLSRGMGVRLKVSASVTAGWLLQGSSQLEQDQAVLLLWLGLAAVRFGVVFIPNSCSFL